MAVTATYHQRQSAVKLPQQFGSPARGGFTLIELMTVISIIVLLIGLLLPMLSRAAQAGRRAQCLSNLRQIGIGMMAYREDHRGLIPEVQSFPVALDQPTVMTALDHYLGTRRVWQCPSDDDYFLNYGSSYEYFLGYYLLLTPDQSHKNQLLARLERMPDLAFVMLDAKGWHPAGPGGSGRHALFLDGHVDWFRVPDDVEALAP